MLYCRRCAGAGVPRNTSSRFLPYLPRHCSEFGKLYGSEKPRTSSTRSTYRVVVTSFRFVLTVAAEVAQKHLFTVLAVSSSPLLGFWQTIRPWKASNLIYTIHLPGCDYVVSFCAHSSRNKQPAVAPTLVATFNLCCTRYLVAESTFSRVAIWKLWDHISVQLLPSFVKIKSAKP